MTTTVEDNIQKQILKIKKPPLYNVVFYNDSVTTFNFVVSVLVQIFNKTHEEAISLSIKIDEKGQAIVAQYPYEIAMTKKQITDLNAKKQNFPLVCELIKD